MSSYVASPHPRRNENGQEIHLRTSVTVRVPSQLRGLTGGEGEVQVEAANVGEALAALRDRFTGLGERIFDDQGQIRRFVNVFVGEEDIRFLSGLETIIGAGQTLSIVPAVAGG